MIWFCPLFYKTRPLEKRHAEVQLITGVGGVPFNTWHLLFLLWLFLLVLSQRISMHTSFKLFFVVLLQISLTFNWLMGYNNILCQSTSEFHNPFESSSPWQEKMYHKSCRYMLGFVVSQPEFSLQCSPSPLSSLQLENTTLIVWSIQWTDKFMLPYCKPCTWRNSCVLDLY